MTLPPGTSVGPYEVCKTIGAGGFATVYLARDPRLEANVALKVLAENHCLDPKVRERFIGEGQMLRRAAGANVLEVHDIGQTKSGQPFLVLEYATRGDLRQRIQRRLAASHPTTPADIRSVVDAISSGLSDLHRHGIVHRDLSPANLLICGSGAAPPASLDRLLADDERIVLADLGFAKDIAASSGLTVGGGTRGFDAPEQRMAASKVDRRADIYGATLLILWMMLGATGQPPREEHALRAALDQLNPSPALRSAILRGAAESADDRFGSIADWRQAMHTAFAPQTQFATTGQYGPAPTPTPPKGWTSRIAIVALTAFVAAATTAGVMLFLDDQVADGTPASQSVVDENTVRTARQLGDLEVSVFGPTEIQVGATAEFEAGLKGIADYRWVDPNGVVQPGHPELNLNGTSVGKSYVVLIGTAPDGRVLATKHQFDVVEASE